jgi:hypothetical protein
MSDRDRVQRWRQRQRAAGKAPLTIWLTADEKLRLEDMAASRRCLAEERQGMAWQGTAGRGRVGLGLVRRGSAWQGRVR